MERTRIMPNSLLLDRTTWDLSVDASGNIAMCSDPYAITQNVATAVRTWQAEAWYDTSLGISYDDGIFSGSLPVSILKAQAETAAENVSGVATAECLFLLQAETRTLSGAIALTLTNGETANVRF